MPTLRDRLNIAMRAAGVSAADLARACRIQPPSVSDWITGKTKTIKGANLLAAAKLLRVSPEWLATGKGSHDRAEAAVDQGSQQVRLDPAMLAETHKACRVFAERQGRVFSVETDPARFLQVYLDRQRLSAEPSQDELIEFGSRLASIMAPQGAVADGRNDGVPTVGTDERKVARRGGGRKT
jgi:transcriptional regulator with XRE-family HTH domain